MKLWRAREKAEADEDRKPVVVNFLARLEGKTILAPDEEAHDFYARFFWVDDNGTSAID